MKQFSDEIIRVVMETKRELSPFLEKLDYRMISKHNRAYMKYALNPAEKFIDQELIRYLYTIDYINSSFSKKVRILDIGFFIPVMPIALAKLGFSVCAVEKLSYYTGALDSIISFVNEKYGIEVKDFDVFGDDVSGLEKHFDIVMLLAVLEHLHGTPKHIINNAKRILRDKGQLIVEVPNVASLSRRMFFLEKGLPPLPDFKDYYHSAYPFSGHNREYTIHDLRYALKESDFNIIRMETFHHSAVKPRGFRGKMYNLLERIGPPSWKANIWAAATPLHTDIQAGRDGSSGENH